MMNKALARNGGMMRCSESDYHLIDIRRKAGSDTLMLIGKVRPVKGSTSGGLTLYQLAECKDVSGYLAREMTRCGYNWYAGVVALPRAGTLQSAGYERREEYEVIRDRLGLGG